MGLDRWTTAIEESIGRLAVGYGFNMMLASDPINPAGTIYGLVIAGAVL